MLYNIDELFENFPEQDLNVEWFDQELLDVCMDVVKKAVPKDKLDKIHSISPIKLNGSLEPHDDISFINANDLSENALLYVFKIELERRKFVDSLDAAWFFCNNEFKILHTEETLWFDASKEHALILEGTLLGFTVWFKNNEE